jgi:hypothetical protein
LALIIPEVKNRQWNWVPYYWKSAVYSGNSREKCYIRGRYDTFGHDGVVAFLPGSFSRVVAEELLKN